MLSNSHTQSRSTRASGKILTLEEKSEKKLLPVTSRNGRSSLPPNIVQELSLSIPYFQSTPLSQSVVIPFVLFDVDAQSLVLKRP